MEVDLDQHELPLWLRGLDRHKQHMSILQGLSCKMSENGHWSYSSVMGAYKSGRNSLSGIKRATIDFELAKLFPSPFGHVELSLTGDYSSFRTGIVSGYSAPGPHQRNYCYADPMTAYNELFKTVTDPGAVDSDNAMLAFLQGEESFKADVLVGYEKLKLSNHIHSIEETQARNKKLESLSGVIKQHLPVIDPIHAFGGLNASTPEKQKAMTDILVAANGEGHHSHGTEAPFVVLAGDNCKLDITGRYIRLPYHGTEGHKTIGNWYTTLLNAHGNPIEHYGDLDLEMSRKKLDQQGSIQQFLS